MKMYTGGRKLETTRVFVCVYVWGGVVWTVVCGVCVVCCGGGVVFQ